MAALHKPPQPLEPPRTTEVGPGLTLLNPLSRKGTGPGLIVVVPDKARGVSIKNGIPSPLMKWAEEGYCVVEVSEQAWEAKGNKPLEGAINSFSTCEKCESQKSMGLVCYDPVQWSRIASSPQIRQLAAAVLYVSAAMYEDLETFEVPTLLHIAGKGTKSPKVPQNKALYYYADEASPHFATPSLDDFHYAGEAVSHTRSLTHLKKHMDGPYFDLEAIWEEHTYYEFEARSVEHTMNTMVQEPYVNHVPTMTGGIGRENLTAFYRDHFIFSNPQDAELELISRTTGIDRVVDEFIYKCTHDRVVDWLLPGVPPTNKRIEIPMMAVVNVRGDRLYHEHIHWDHATALKQVGLLPEYIAFNEASGPMLNGAHQSLTGPKQQLRLPVAGIEGSNKMRDKNSVPSNAMFGWGVRTVS